MEITRSYKSLESVKLITIGKKLTFAYKVVKTHSYSIICDAAIAKQALPPSQASFQAQMQTKQLALSLNFQIIEGKKKIWTTIIITIESWTQDSVISVAKLCAVQTKIVLSAP